MAAAVLGGLLLAAPAARADAPRTAVFGFELDDTSLQGSMQGADKADQVRLQRLDGQLRAALAQSSRFDVVAVATDPSAPSWWTCDGCEVDAARKAGAAYSVVGWVQKVSNLILNINIVVRDVKTGKRVAAGSVDIRGDTDESWSRGLSFLVRNRILNGGW
ncbi:MAG TPA: DUF3280 domain-containing protein [Acetobacteraceae bacterium]|nr:DUF3280 domain-containing protein [Acetobacteraceae bacterium]